MRCRAMWSWSFLAAEEACLSATVPSSTFLVNFDNVSDRGDFSILSARNAVRPWQVRSLLLAYLHVLFCLLSRRGRSFPQAALSAAAFWSSGFSRTLASRSFCG